MRIYFGETSERDVEVFGTDGLFEVQDQFYGYFVEFGSNPGGIEDIVVQDGCGRKVPVCLEHIPQLIQALAECYNIGAEIAHGQDLQDFAEGQDNTAVVCEHGHIHY